MSRPRHCATVRAGVSPKGGDTRARISVSRARHGASRCVAVRGRNRSATKGSVEMVTLTGPLAAEGFSAAADSGFCAHTNSRLATPRTRRLQATRLAQWGWGRPRGGSTHPHCRPHAVMPRARVRATVLYRPRGLRNSSSGGWDQPNPARRTKKNRSAFTSSNLPKTCGNDPSAKKTSRRGTAITREPLMHPSEEKGGFRHPLPRARTQ